MEFRSVPRAMFRAHWYRALVSLWYGRKVRPAYKPLLRAEFANGDLFAQADFLLKAGYREAAVMTARVAVERHLRRMTLVIPGWRRSPRTPVSQAQGISDLSNFLFHHEVFDVRLRKTSINSRRS